MRLLVDTTVVSDYLSHKRRAEASPVVRRVEAYVREHGVLEFSVLTYYETARFLKRRGSIRHLAAFEQLCHLSLIFPLDASEMSDSVWPRAMDLWAMCRDRNARLGEADILIVATALTYGRGIVSSDEGFKDIEDLVHLEDWRQEVE